VIDSPLCLASLVVALSLLGTTGAQNYLRLSRTTSPRFAFHGWQRVTVNQTRIIWFTGMSGSGKSTFSVGVKQELTAQGLTVCIIDGDTVREGYQQKLGFSREEVMQNNLHIASLCQKVRADYNVILVPVISPFALVL
jgi:adenylylsulfate kinase-like enzyme